jgi:hypothetical protein
MVSIKIIIISLSTCSQKTPQIIFVDYKTRDDMPSYLENSRVKLKELNDHKYKY